MVLKLQTSVYDQSPTLTERCEVCSVTVKLEVVGARTSNAPSSPNPPTDVKKAQVRVSSDLGS